LSKDYLQQHFLLVDDDVMLMWIFIRLLLL